mmetsp:Transcript_12386/g.39468  ORF Transcript_12386/g.39468 Transcript_12386/m.39468 type:complete len:246 (+) Transcript_12386:430-1167(+)
MMTSCVCVMKMMEVWSCTAAGNHSLWSANVVTFSPRKFQSSTSESRKERKHWCSYKKMKANGVWKRSCGTVTVSFDSRSMMSSGSHSCCSSSFWLNCSMTTILTPRFTSCLKSRSTSPDSMERMRRGWWAPRSPPPRLSTSSMMPGEILISSMSRSARSNITRFGSSMDQTLYLARREQKVSTFWLTSSNSTKPGCLSDSVSKSLSDRPALPEARSSREQARQRSEEYSSAAQTETMMSVLFDLL